MLRWQKKSAYDIARARVGVFDDDHPLAYTGGGVGSTQLQCGSSALAPCPDPELRERRSNLRPSLDRLPKPSTVRTLTPRHGGSEDQPWYGVAHWLGRAAPRGQRFGVGKIRNPRVRGAATDGW